MGWKYSMINVSVASGVGQADAGRHCSSNVGADAGSPDTSGVDTAQDPSVG